MRVHRSFIDADAVDLWEQRTRETFGSLVAKDGLVTAVAGVELAGSDASANKGGAGIVVLTTWAEWGVLLSATGGRLERALTVTESPDPERPVRVDLYEILRVGSE